MKKREYVSAEYRQQLSELAELLCRPIGQAALRVVPEVAPLPIGLTLCDPPEAGWHVTPPEAA